MNEPKIRPAFKLFATYYMGECLGNAEKSALKAGYSKNYARGNANKLLKRKDVQQYMAYLKELQEKDPSNAALHIATVSEIQAFWTNVMNNEDEVMKNRLRASELLAKARGMFVNEW